MRAARVPLVGALALASALALALPSSSAEAQVPTPESVLGFPVGADFELATYEESLEYFRRLDAASDRLSPVAYSKLKQIQDGPLPS